MKMAQQYNLFNVAGAVLNGRKNMKIALITDQHFGGKQDSQNFLNHIETFYREQFFPYLSENNIHTVIDLGDTFDRRKFVNFNTLDPNSGSPTFSPNTSELIGTQYKSSINGSKWIWNGNLYIPGVLGSRIYVNINNAEIKLVGFTDLTELAQTVATIINKFTNTTLSGSSITNSVFIQLHSLYVLWKERA